MTTHLGTVGELWRYPVKSMLGEQVTSIGLTNLGVDGDRRFALRDLTNNKIVSSKQPKFGSKLLLINARINEADNNVEITVGGTTYRASETEAINAALSELLERPVAFVSATANDETYESYWPEMEGLALSDVTTDFPIGMFTAKGTFTDLAALHLVTTTSIAALRALLPDTLIDVRRFRPSIVIDSSNCAFASTQTFIENDWVQKTLTVGHAEIALSLAAPRCIMTTLAQPELPQAKEVLQALAQHNRIAFDGFGNFACLGVYAEVTKPGSIAIGDAVTLN